MKVWVLYKEQETDDINYPDFEDVETFENKEQAEQAAYWLNWYIESPYDKQYNGWSVGEARTVR